MVGMILLCSFAAIGVILLIWTVTALLVLPLRGEGLRCVLHCSAQENLEQQARAYLWLYDMGLLRAPLHLLDCGMSDEQRYIAETLARRNASILYVPKQPEEAWKVE